MVKPTSEPEIFFTFSEPRRRSRIREKKWNYESSVLSVTICLVGQGNGKHSGCFLPGIFFLREEHSQFNIYHKLQP